jgi:hypothetical protein
MAAGADEGRSVTPFTAQLASLAALAFLAVLLT